MIGSKLSIGPDYLAMAILLTADATDACIRCGTTDRTSVVEIRPHRVWCCSGCYAAVLSGFAYHGPAIPSPVPVQAA
jgi:hypothetical protein